MRENAQPWELSGISVAKWRAFLVAQMVKNLLAMQKTRVRSLHQKDSLEEGMATHSSILAWRIPWTEEPGGLQSVGSQRVRHAKHAHTQPLLNGLVSEFP